jgi:hypothetical protein
MGIVVHVFKEVMGSEVFSRALRDMLSLYSNKVLKLLAKGQDVLQGKNVRESVKTHRGKVVKDFVEQGARTLLRQTGHGSKRRRIQRSNLSSVKKQKLEEDPRRPKWITKDERDCDGESSHDDESESETSQTSDDIY